MLKLYVLPKLLAHILLVFDPYKSNFFRGLKFYITLLPFKKLKITKSNACSLFNILNCDLKGLSYLFANETGFLVKHR